MINGKKEIIIKMVINRMELNEYNLHKNGILDNDIKGLIDEEIIVKNNDGSYKYVDAKGLYFYGKKMVSLKRHFEARECFKRSYELGFENREKNLSTLVWNTDSKDVINIFDKIKNVDYEIYEKDYNLLLYMFSGIMDLDKEHSLLTSSIKIEDIMLDKFEYSIIDNDIRRCIMQNKYEQAYVKLNGISTGSSRYYNILQVLSSLIRRSLTVERQFKNDILNCAKNEDYDSIILKLKNKEKQRKLNHKEQFILELTLKVKEFMGKKKIDFIIGNKNTNNISKAVSSNNFSLALELNKKFLDKTKGNPDDDIVNVLLLKLNDIVYELSYIDLNDNEMLVNVFSQVVDNLNKGECLDLNMADINLNNDDASYKSSYEFYIKDAEEWAYYLRGLGGDFNSNVKKAGLIPKYVLWIKLIYARDYYNDGNIFRGDMFLNEVEQNFIEDENLISFLEEVKSIRNNNLLDEGHFNSKKR